MPQIEQIAATYASQIFWLLVTFGILYFGIGKVMVPHPVLSTPSVVALNWKADEKWRAFISAWAEYNRRIGNNQTWIVNSLAPFGITLDDMPEGFGFGG